MRIHRQHLAPEVMGDPAQLPQGNLQILGIGDSASFE
jgi:hypothetical protein